MVENFPKLNSFWRRCVQNYHDNGSRSPFPFCENLNIFQMQKKCRSVCNPYNKYSINKPKKVQQHSIKVYKRTD